MFAGLRGIVEFYVFISVYTMESRPAGRILFQNQLTSMRPSRAAVDVRTV